MSFSPDHSPSLRGEAFAQLRCANSEAIRLRHWC
jgi:hypothetical protein